MMKAAVFVEPNRIVLEDKPIPGVGPLDALIRMAELAITSGAVTLSMVDVTKAPISKDVRADLHLAAERLVFYESCCSLTCVIARNASG